MAQINCTVTNCYFNKKYGCTAPTIKVDGKKAFESRSTCCNTFVVQKPGVMSSTSEPQKNSTIVCDAKHCFYNKNEKCTASNIIVNGKNAETYEETCCSTFKPHQ